MARKDRIPQLKLHKATGQGYVLIDGHRHYLGRHGRPETRQAYDRFIHEWLANGRQLPGRQDEVTVVELIARFWRHVKAYYRAESGSPTTEQRNFKMPLRALKALYGRTPAAEFGPSSLKAVRQSLIDGTAPGMRGPGARTRINKDVARIKQFFKWAVSEELIPPSVYHGLQAVDGLKRGRSTARESEPVRPVPQEHVDAVLPHVSRQVAAMIQVQLVSGMRPGELVRMRKRELDRSGRTWVYRPPTHKTQHHGHDRQILLGPKTQRILAPFLLRGDDAYLFSAAEAEQERLAKLHEARTTPPHHGNRPGTNRRKHPKHQPGGRYTRDSYRRAIHRACAKAKVPRWSPHRLRHNAATLWRKEFGIDLAQTILGHRLGSTITEVYAEQDRAKALKAVGEIG